VPIGAITTATPSGASSNSSSNPADAFTTNLKGTCPSTIVVQTNWWPEPDHGYLYELIGPGGTVDTQNDSYTGPLGKTGVKLQINAGGPAVGYQQVTSQLYQNPNILLGMVGTDEAIQNSASQPTVAVFGGYVKNPQIFFWGNPKWNFTSVPQIGKTNDEVLAYNGATYLSVFTGKGWLKQSQLNTSYQGSPAQFVAANGSVLSQGFATYEPYIYEHELAQWDKPVKELLVGNSYPVYQNALAVRADALSSDKACLAKLVPLIQQAEVDYIHNPGPVNKVLVNEVSQLQAKGFVLNDASAAWAVQQMLKYGIVGNGTDGVLGSFNGPRIQGLINELTPVFDVEGKTPKSGLAPSGVATNQFLDKQIHL